MEPIKNKVAESEIEVFNLEDLWDGKPIREIDLADFLVEVGGEIRTHGRAAEDRPWRVAIERPSTVSRSAQKVVEIADRALATSGDYRNFWQKDGVRYSHTIDPRSGRPIDHRLASVTVVDSSTAKADALATALMVLGPEEGYRLAEREDIAAWGRIRAKDGFIERQTPSFDLLRADRNT